MITSDSLFDKKDFRKHVVLHGGVHEACDATSLFCQVYTIQGAVPASHYLSYKTGTVVLKGGYVYVCMLGLVGRPYVFHLYLVCDNSNLQRISCSNMYTEPRMTATGLQLPGPVDRRWQFLAFDVNALLALYTSGFAVYRGLRGVELCANLSVRGVYSSDHPMAWEHLPRRMRMPIPKVRGRHQEGGPEGHTGP